jgi:hypothetical protein
VFDQLRLLGGIRKIEIKGTIFSDDKVLTAFAEFIQFMNDALTEVEVRDYLPPKSKN